MAATLFVLFLGIGFAYVGSTYSALSRRMRSFVGVQGKVIARAVVPVPSGNTMTGRFGEGGGFTPQVTYRYVVGGTEFESNKLAHAVRGYKRSVAERKLAEIPEEIVVWYDPVEPSHAYLRRHGPAAGYALFALGACMIGGALIGLSGN
jgi:hypothetical protein